MAPIFVPAAVAAPCVGSSERRGLGPVVVSCSDSEDDLDLAALAARSVQPQQEPLTTPLTLDDHAHGVVCIKSEEQLEMLIKANVQQSELSGLHERAAAGIEPVVQHARTQSHEEEVVEEEASDLSVAGVGVDVIGTVQLLRKYVVPHCVGKEQQHYDVLRGLALSGTAIHGKCVSRVDIQQAFGDTVQW
jgi:hypothetical protein